MERRTPRLKPRRVRLQRVTMKASQEEARLRSCFTGLFRKVGDWSVAAVCGS